MRLTRIQLTGYSRFRDADCSVDEPVIAFVGPNEAGKSTLLRALDWLTDPKAKALPVQVRNRDHPPQDYEVVVRAVFILGDDEMATVRALDIDTEEHLDLWTGARLSMERLADGTGRTVLTPALHRNLAPVNDALSAIARARTADELDERAELLFDALDAQLEVSNPAWTEARAQRLTARRDELESLTNELAAEVTEGEGDPAVWAMKDVLKALVPAIASATAPEPDEVAREALAPMVPKFLLFKEADRELPAAFNALNNDGTIPNALSNILAIAGSSVADVAAAIGRGQTPRLTAQRDINSKLSVIADYWSQNRADGQRLHPHIGLNETGNIDIGVDDVEGVIAINERSDGLQTYLALIAFLLSSHDREVPKILLIDEAERNLHYDAQGDLVRLLTNDLPVTQVLYSTHSPGCLPLDLGTGIRVVARSATHPKDSELSDRFWTDQEPGFSRLLLAMGAEAAAFSAINAALLTEGPSEMILLPHLLRKADPSRKIDFQVSFGLSNMSIPNDIGEIAIRTTFLVDGDAEGNRKINKLKRAGVPESNRLQLPQGMAIEDLLDRELYLDTVDAVIRDTFSAPIPVDRGAVRADLTIAKAIDVLTSPVTGFKAPGHKHVALRLAAEPQRIELSAEGHTYLRDVLWPQIETAFARTYQLGAA